jgi:hypothetical protein
MREAPHQEWSPDIWKKTMIPLGIWAETKHVTGCMLLYAAGPCEREVTREQFYCSQALPAADSGFPRSQLFAELSTPFSKNALTFFSFSKGFWDCLHGVLAWNLELMHWSLSHPTAHIRMYYSLGRARLALNLPPVSISPPLRRPLSSLRSAYLSSSTANFTRTCWHLPRRALSNISDSPDGLFNYTSGRWL